MPVVDLVPIERAGLTVLEITPFLAFGVDAFLTTRHGGVSRPPYDELNLGLHVGDEPAAVAENRRRLAVAAGVDEHRLIFTTQVHGSGVNVVRELGSFTGDALVSTRDDVALVIGVADCLPVLIADPFTTTFAVVHAGWRGLECGVLAATLATFADVRTAHVFVGPGISAARYQVGLDVAAHFADVPAALTPDGPDHARLDLVAVARHQLATLGVPAGQLFTTERTTDDTDTFFSARAAAPTGRSALVARRALYDDSVVRTQ
jgi:hypothetical protein